MFLAPLSHPPLPHRSLSASRLPYQSFAPPLHMQAPVPCSLSTAMPRTAGLGPQPPLTRLRTRSYTYTADGPRSPDLLAAPLSPLCNSDDDHSSSPSSANSSPVTPVHDPLLLSAPRLPSDALPLWTHFESLAKPSRPRARSEPLAPPTRAASTLLLGRLALLALLLLVSLLIVALALSTLPALRLPTSLSAVRVQISGLRAYAHLSNLTALHTTAVLGTVFVFKQAFSVPGTVLMNVLMGAVYGTPLATAITCLLTAVGSCGAYAMARVARPVVCRLLPGPLAAVEQAVTRFRLPVSEKNNPETVATFDSTEIASYLLVARLVPVVPYAGLNLASGVLGIPLRPFFWTLIIGSLPYNFVTTQVGEILQIATDGLSTTTTSTTIGTTVPRITSLWTYTLMIKLIAVSVVGLLPVLCKGKVKLLVNRLKRRGVVGEGVGVGGGWVRVDKKSEEEEEGEEEKEKVAVMECV